MKICILSMQKIDNYGSVLQAYSLKKMIESLGHNVSFIDIREGENSKLNYECYKLSLKENTEKGKIVNEFLNKINNKVERLKVKRVFDEFRNNCLCIGKCKNNQYYDVCVIGSDEVFNCLQISKWGFDKQLFGKVDNAKKVITYAACCGYTTKEMLSPMLLEAISSSFSNIQSFSVRDENTREFVEDISNRKCEFNMDPVIVGNFEKEINDVNIKGKVPKKYCILYSYKNRFSDEKSISIIQEYCKKNGLEIIAPFGSQTWIKKRKILNPFELLKAFVNAEAIITDTFHGAIFGAKFGNKLAIIIRESNKNKLIDLTVRLEIGDHVVMNIENLEQVINKPINKNKISMIIETERKKALEYLKNNICL